MAKKKITTLENLAVAMEKGFEKADARIDNLAVAMEKGFKAADKRMDVGFEKADKKTDEKIESLALMVQKGFEEVRDELKVVNKKLDLLERGQEDLKLRQDNVPYRFELKEQEEILEEHDKRIRTLEKKVLSAR